jgi:hypothetical protein
VVREEREAVMNRVVVGLLGVTILFGMKFFNKSSDSNFASAK